MVLCAVQWIEDCLHVSEKNQAAGTVVGPAW